MKLKVDSLDFIPTSYSCRFRRLSHRDQYLRLEAKKRMMTALSEVVIVEWVIFVGQVIISLGWGGFPCLFRAVVVVVVAAVIIVLIWFAFSLFIRFYELYLSHRSLIITHFNISLMMVSGFSSFLEGTFTFRG